MSATLSTVRLSRAATLAVAGAAALSLAACGNSSETKPAPASPSSNAPSSSTPSASGKGHDWVKGIVDSVSGSTVKVTAKSGPTTVDFTPSTAIDVVTPAQLTDVTAGSCVWVHPDKDDNAPAGSPITARAVKVSAAVDGKCPGPQRHADEKSHHKIPPHGQVASVAGNTITLNSTDEQGNPSTTTVNVTDTTKYMKKTAADAQAIVQGKCLAAHGTRDNGGALQATRIDIRDAENGQCPEHGKHHDR
ncbi:DUF5666 domain-containing protein [Mycobacterium sp.]|uniref:DUF5666 domain-containing protein n=1 Tax=Mycobacterium sp. TaxID=1785 RepID=UPI0025E86A50|nr:DUF5666 domain-containing protein [Mycobacterium sp.]